MNIDDVDVSGIPVPGDRLDLMFVRQRELMTKYSAIEITNGFMAPELPLDLHNKHHQLWIKEQAWRVTEEFAEATEAFEFHVNIPAHFYEELSDAYHFLIELLITVGIDTERLCANIEQDTFGCKLTYMMPENARRQSTDIIRLSCYSVIEKVGLAMNCLKNKPWKQTHMLTDILQFEQHLIDAHQRFIHLTTIVGLSAQSFYILYYKKSEVNKFRQRTDY